MIAVLIFYLRQMEFFPGYVKKTIPHSSVYMTTTEFEELYHAIWVEKPASIINLYKLPTPGRHSTSLLLTPIGYPASPSTIDELKLAVKDSLSGLQWLYTKGFVHRDVRWPIDSQEHASTITANWSSCSFSFHSPATYSVQRMYHWIRT